MRSTSRWWKCGFLRHRGQGQTFQKRALLSEQTRSPPLPYANGGIRQSGRVTDTLFLGTKAHLLCNAHPHVVLTRKLNMDEPFRKFVGDNVSYFIIRTLKEMDYSFKIPFLRSK